MFFHEKYLHLIIFIQVTYLTYCTVFRRGRPTLKKSIYTFIVVFQKRFLKHFADAIYCFTLPAFEQILEITSSMLSRIILQKWRNAIARFKLVNDAWRCTFGCVLHRSRFCQKHSGEDNKFTAFLCLRDHYTYK